ncbi:MAG: nicotinate phosphoribosyltransferase [Sphingomonadales bacterium]|nr:nicotinate phosphoribosyltransferase [Sphingomonadales bacterium]MDE2171096.1 nicotinate phosphoribosyltransferase [Sphingomonadales bacterium]
MPFIRREHPSRRAAPSRPTGNSCVTTFPANLILATDSYKHSHFLQYPPEMRVLSAYIEARQNILSNRVLFLGLQPFLIGHLSHPVTMADVKEAEEVTRAHGVPFNRAGWERIVTIHGGHLPLSISALPEGMIVPTGVPLVQVENTDPALGWLTTFIETALLRAIWYPTTVATISWRCRAIIRAGLLKTSDDPEGQLPFKLHDFGARGVSSAESASLGGMAHLVNFSGTDTMEGLMAARRYYDADMAGFSIPAAEHSTITAWGREREGDAYANMLARFDEGAVAVVSDSYDLDRAVSQLWGGALYDKVMAHKGTLVIRPDSGDPVETPLRVLETLWGIFGGRVNGKGYRLLDDHVRVIQGDGMSPVTITRLIDRLVGAGFAIDNIAFGMGGGLLQHVNRDTLSFAMKADAMRDDAGLWHDIAKTPATDPAKRSKPGRQAVVMDGDAPKAVRLDALGTRTNLLQKVWRDGRLLCHHHFNAVRERSRQNETGQASIRP